MKEFKEFLEKITSKDKRVFLEKMLLYIERNFPNLEKSIKWNQPMFMDHGTFIIAFSLSKNHVSVAPELKAMDKFKTLIIERGYQVTKMLFKIKYTDNIDYDLLKQIIEYNILDKKNAKTFWRQ